jgi:dihydrofolate reductase
MRKLFASIWMTLDGVFDADSMEHWFFPYNTDARMAYIQDVLHSTDAILFGRTTYEMLAPYWSTLHNNEMGIAAKLNSAAKYVVSNTLKRADWNNSTIISENVLESVTNLKQQPGGDIHIEGSSILVNSLLEAGLIDELRILLHPYLVGSGKHIFNDSTPMTKLELVKTETLSLGVILLSYQPVQ